MSVIDHPKHYAEATHGIAGECITYTEHLGFVRGNAFKYAWRAGFKGDPLEDLGKALWYVRRDITHGGTGELDHPGHLSYQLSSGPWTLRRRILMGIWSRHDLTATHALLATALEDPAALDKEIYMTAKRYRKKPVEVEVMHFSRPFKDVAKWCSGECIRNTKGGIAFMVIHTLEGDMRADPGDYIIKGVNGEFYPCKPDIFAKTYEPVEEI